MIKIIDTPVLDRSDVFAIPVGTDDIRTSVSEIISAIRKDGDKALMAYTEKFDGVRLGAIRVTSDEIERAVEKEDKRLIEVLEKAAESIRFFHKNQLRQSFEISNKPGVILGQKIIPIACAGLYVPGGTAAYPSTVLMNAIPAKIAGCKRIVMVTPPKKDGSMSSAILAAAKIAGVDEIYKIGGAQAIAALAYGTESVPKADKIVGPGNAYVAEAKRQVYGAVSIDMIAGPSEIMIIADETNRAEDTAADLLSQAEHDRMASAVLVTDSPRFAKAVSEEIERQLPLLEREDIARVAIDMYGKIIIADNLDKCIDIANMIAPEHLEICVDEPMKYLDRIENAGSVFLGKYCPEALGDYMAGTNHTLPTGGTSRFSSPLSVDDFIKKTQYIYYDKSALAEICGDIEYFANREGLTAHARSAVIRFENEND